MAKKKKSSSKAIVPEVLAPEKNQKGGLVPRGDALAQYMAEVSRYPVLSKDEEYDLAVKYRETGDPEAAQKLVTSNLRFVVKVANEYAKFGSKVIDLVQEGNVGLMHAVKEFNPYKGVRLITYAVWWIRGQIQEYLMRQYSMVKIGTTQAQRKLFYQLQKQKDELERMGLEAGVKQLSGRLGVSEKDVELMSNRMSSRDVSLDAPLSDEDGSATLIDIQADENFEDPVESMQLISDLSHLKDSIDELRSQLNEREIYLLDHRLLADQPSTLQEIGDKYSVTREAVRQMEARLLTKLRTKFEN